MEWECERKELSLHRLPEREGGKELWGVRLATTFIAPCRGHRIHRVLCRQQEEQERGQGKVRGREGRQVGSQRSDSSKRSRASAKTKGMPRYASTHTHTHTANLPTI